MTIEVFERGSNFKMHLANYHNIDKIDNDFDGGKIIFIKDNETMAVLNFNLVELKIS